MRILLTGAGGFLGGAIARRLIARDDIELIATSRRAPALDGALALDLADRAAIDRALTTARPDIVVHAAGRAEGPPNLLAADNAVATANLAEAMSAAAPSAGLILLSSAGQYGARSDKVPWRESDPGQPTSPYGLSKQAGEASAFAASRQSGLKITALRLFNVIGPKPTGGQVFASFLDRAADAVAGGPPPWRVRMGPLGSVRDFIAVDDVLRAVEAVIDRGVWGETINVCSGAGRPARVLIEATAAGLPGELVIEEDPASDAGALWSVGDPALCEARLGFRPSADLTAITGAAAAWIMEQAHARSHA